MCLKYIKVGSINRSLGAGIRAQAMNRTTRSSFFVTLGFLAFSGCASTVQLSSIEDASQHFEGRSASLLLKSGKTYQARDIRLGEDSVVFVDQSTDSTLHYCSTDIESFQDFNHVRGAFDGLIVGGLMSVPAGLIMRSTNRPDAGLASIALVVTAVPLGILLGLLEGHQSRYRLQADSAFRKDSGPTSSSNQSPLQGKGIAP